MAVQPVSQLRERLDRDKYNSDPFDLAADFMSDDNRLMQLARTEARQSTNRRGVLNSSLTAGASVDAMTRAALPLVQQKSEQLEGRNVRQEQDVFRERADQQQFGFARALSEQESEQRRGEAQQQFGFSRALSAQEAEQQERASRQQFGFSRELSSQEAEQSERAARQQFGFQSALSEQQAAERLTEAQRQFGFDRAITAQQIAAASDLSEQESLQRIEQINADFAQRGLLSAQEFQQTQNLSDQEFQQQTGLTRQQYEQDLSLQAQRLGTEMELAVLDANSRQTLMQMEQAMRESLSNLETDATAYSDATSMLTAMNQQYQESVRSILGNSNMSAADRNALLENAGDLLNIQTDMVGDLYGFDIDWAGGTFNPAPGESTPSTGSGGNTSGADTSAGSGGGGSTVVVDDRNVGP